MPGWSSYQVSGRLLTLALPPSWAAEPPFAGEVFNAFNKHTKAQTNVYVYGRYPSRKEFFARIAATARRTYRKQDPNAVIRTRAVKLPSGTALQLIAELTRNRYSHPYRLWVVNYNIFHNGQGYDVAYQGPPSRNDVDLPVFEKSAHSVRFAS